MVSDRLLNRVKFLTNFHRWQKLDRLPKAEEVEGIPNRPDWALANFPVDSETGRCWNEDRLAV